MKYQVHTTDSSYFMFMEHINENMMKSTTTTTTATTTSCVKEMNNNNNNNNWKDPSVYRLPKEADDDDKEVRPRNYCDYRNLGGPLLSYVWCRSTESEPTITNVINATTSNNNNNVDLNNAIIHSSEDEHNKGSILQGQTLYLGAEISSFDGCMYCIPGHADRVLKIDPNTNIAIQIGPKFIGRKYKWLRGVTLKNGTIYGLPCHADTVLKIDVPNNTITELAIQYEIFFPLHNDTDSAHEERYRQWKYHGGNISPIDGCIYAIPQSALYVLKVDPNTDICTLIGPKLDGKYKFYGGVIGKQDGAIYGIPHNSPHVLRIHPIDGITLHGELHDGGTHKWHGGAAASNGVIVCVPANADTILCITPTTMSEPILTLIGNNSVVQSGRHRNDRKYKYLGATTGPDGRVYCFPCAAEYVLAVDTVQMSVHQIGPNIYDANMERLCQNKWQNGVYMKHCNRIYGIPLAAESILQIDFDKLDHNGDPTISTWPIPAPYRNMGKWEGAVVAHNGIAYGIPNNHKASLRIESTPTTTTTTYDNNDNDIVQDVNNTAMTCPTSIASNDIGENDESNLLTLTTHVDEVYNKNNNDRPDYSNRDDLIYKSGIPTLRASAHRVKFSPKSRTNNPCPKNHMGIETGTLWLPKEICQEYVFSYDTSLYNFNQVIYNILQRCDTNIVGYFRNGSTRLEDFVVPIKSTWRIVNGGQCEDAQKYLSDIISNDNIFLQLFDDFVTNVILCNLKKRLIASLYTEKNDDDDDDDDIVLLPMTFYYQRPPTLRLQPGPAWAQVKAHNDVEYGHQYGELNFWIPLTDRIQTGVDLYCESLYNNNDYHPIIAKVGDIISFHGSSCRHYVNTNSSQYTRVSFDFRVGVQGYFDPNWEMQGTNDDHSRREITI